MVFMTNNIAVLTSEKRKIKVCAAVLQKDEKVLIAQRGPKGASGGKWEFPGGKIEIGETPEECLKREILEELGVVIDVGAFICSNTFTYEKVILELFAYKINYVSGEFVLNVHDDMKWVDIQALLNYEFPEADLPIIEAIQSDIKIT
ncbi:MAG: 8-oxo-dGTP diphosphatase [Chlamydiales bacterium]|jgi:8-oxo-dGTP diphosphatase